MIEINGNRGGGQVLRTALSLSLLTSQPFTIRNIRGKRPKPGLMRQHLACVLAAAEVSDAETRGAELRSTELTFLPGDINPGNYEFAIGSAGSTSLVLQTVLPALAECDEPSTIRIAGGTHNPMAPTATFLEKSFLPAIERFGILSDFKCLRIGFAPSGGGIITCSLSKSEAPYPPAPPGTILHILSTALPDHVPRKIAMAAKEIIEITETIVEDAAADGSGGCIHIRCGRAMALGFAQLGVSAKRIGINTAKEMKSFLESGAEVTPQLADQLMLYLGLAGKGSLTTNRITNHIKSNAETIAQFLPVEFTFAQESHNIIRITADQ